ncbi:hypothetical protein [Paenibacillus sp. 32352]|uniref:phage baseplate plug family protein n=1 Tax=Paenibacillus sp. 32352 TaxID=1969111 RepID=UPI0009ACA0AD|nr:hypothetical protein [Paenibacillus sp. 32352]
MEYIDIEKKNIPYRFDIALKGTVFTFEIHYNADFDFFTVDLERNGEILVQGEKMVYGVPLFGDMSDSRLPSVSIVPYDESGMNEAVTWSTLNESVFLFLGSVEDG